MLLKICLTIYNPIILNIVVFIFNIIVIISTCITLELINYKHLCKKDPFVVSTFFRVHIHTKQIGAFPKCNFTAALINLRINHL